MHTLLRTAVFLVAIPVVAAARDVTDAEMQGVRQALPFGEDRILKLDAYWGEVDGVWYLEGKGMSRPFEVGQGLCVAESYQIRRAESEDTFRVINSEAPISQYWEKGDSCEVADARLLPPTVAVPLRVATTHVAQIIRYADEILRLATPDVRCDERIMTTLFETGVRLRLIGIDLDSRNRPGVGMQYTAYYLREGLRDDDGVTVSFAILPDRLDISFACYWNS